MTGEQTHWSRWHADYADPESALSHRLAAVVARTRAAVGSVPPGRVCLVSVCAGQAHDVVAALARHPRSADVQGRLVELDPANVTAATASLAAAGLTGLAVVEGDAGQTGAYAGAVPADVVLLCGVLGNVPDADAERTVRHLSMLCAPGATVVWTRHRRAPDLTPAVRSWFAESGFADVGFDSPGEQSWAVGAARLVGQPVPFGTGTWLFTFDR